MKITSRSSTLLLSVIIIIITISLLTCRESSDKSYDPSLYSGWNNYAGTKDGMRYSSNDQVDTTNVSRLKIAWQFSTYDRDTGNRSQIQCNPIMVDGVLYGISPRMKLFALNATNGKQLWLFDPATFDTTTKNDPFAYFKISRGVTYWQNKEGTDKRLFYSVTNKTFAINATNGQPIKSFGHGGYIDLTENLDRENDSNAFVSGTSPGIIYNDLLILGSRVSESADAAPGHIRAYDVQTGERRWIFHTIPHPGEVGYDTWPDKDAWRKLGGANNWAGMSLDEKRGIVYVPTGSIGGDFYGGFRKGTNLFANSLIALDAATGKYIWHFQVVHHDLWDRDLPATPNLITLYKNGKKVDAVAQITKSGNIFLFDRTNGKPLFPIEEKPVPQNALPGEEPWPTQPVPTLPEPFARQSFDANDITDISTQSHDEMMEKFRAIKYSHMYAPPSKEGSWIFPGFDGGGEWGGAAVDPETGILYVNSSELPWSLVMIDVPKKEADLSMKANGKNIYNKYCLTCHGEELKGIGSAYPSLIGIEKKYNEDELGKIIEYGKNMMPGFKQITGQDKASLITFILDKNEHKSLTSSSDKKRKSSTPKPTDGRESNAPAKKSIMDEVPYLMTGYNRFLDKNGYPGIKPPWGTLNAVDLNSGKLLWKVPLGEFEELKQKGIPATGTQVYGGVVVTKGGLIFVASTQDEKIRAYNKISGKILWEAQLPAAGYATPSVYQIDGKQYIVIACGGGKVGSKSGDQYVAFALP